MAKTASSGGGPAPVTKVFLWDDNPADTDLLGFDAVVVPVLAALKMPQLDPLTIGVHARWGGGKSTVLSLIGSALKEDASTVVVNTNPWAYDDQADVKGTLIAEILGALEEVFKTDAKVSAKVASLLKRISWSRVAGVLAKGALTHDLELETLATALTPKKRTAEESMSGFRSAFGEFVKSLPGVTRVVVLVDDLDRCLPPAVMGTLEAIKLFLSVEGMVFIIAADQDMVKDAIAMNLAASPRGERFAQRYLDKIVQLPISLPHLPPHESETYIGLLLAQAEFGNEDFTALLTHCQDRRKNNQLPIMSGLDVLKTKPSDDALRLASQLAHGLRTDKIVNPREIKRFLNAFSIRQQIAVARGVSIRPDVIAKLLLLEDRYRSDFETLAGTPDSGRPALLKKWETWATGSDAKAKKPEGISDESKEWAAADPKLGSATIGPYLTLAAALAVILTDNPIDDELAALLARILGASEADRGRAMKDLENRSLSDKRLLLESLFARSRQAEDVSPSVEAALAIAQQTPDLAEEIAKSIKENCWQQLDAGIAVDLASSSLAPIKALATLMASDKDIAPEVAQAAKEVLQGAS